MKQILIDSSALLALVDASDQHHEPAAVFARANPTAMYYLPDTIFAETMVLTKARLGAKAAIELGERLMESRHFVIIYLTADDRRMTWDIFRRYADKHWSYVDCSIMAMTQRLEITEVLSFDHHFDQMPEIFRVPRI